MSKRYYLASARELVRINGTTKAPVMNHASESSLGVVTIRAFAMTEKFIHTNLQLIDTDATLFFHTIAALEWVLLRVETLQNLTVFTSTLLLVFIPRGVITTGTVTMSSGFQVPFFCPFFYWVEFLYLYASGSPELKHNPLKSITKFT